MAADGDGNFSRSVNDDVNSSTSWNSTAVYTTVGTDGVGFNRRNTATDDGDVADAFKPHQSTDAPPPQTTTMSTAMTTGELVVHGIYFAVGSLGLIGNIFVVVVIVSWKNMRRKMTNMLIINQSCIDLTVGAVLIMSRAVEWFKPQWLASNSLDDQIYCRLWATRTILFSLMMSSTYGVLALTIERLALDEKIIAEHF